MSITSRFSTPIVILDGAFGTELERHGCDIKDPLWSSKVLIDNPEMIKKVHISYLEAGAHIIESAGYQSTVVGFERHGFSREEAVQLVKASLRLGKEARNAFIEAKKKGLTELYGIPLSTGEVQEVPLLAASIGPYGAFLADGSEYVGHYGVSHDTLVDFHKERFYLLLEEGADAYAFETVPSLEEAKAIVEVVESVDANVLGSTWISFSCKDDTHISSGETIEAVAQYLHTIPSIHGIGINCTAPEYVESLVKSIRQVTDKTILVYPNLGETYDGVTKTWHGNPSLYFDNVKSWISAGANVIGGCCRTSPDTIQRLREIVK